jgi:two-component system, OmpR family, sensor histidine kinase SenX3
MSSPLKQKALACAVPAAMACVLIVLAVLQYRWSREVSEATRTRMQASLQASLMHFRQDLSRELGAMCLDMQAGTGNISADARSLAEKLQRWQVTTSHPGLAANVYLWDPSNEYTSLFHLSVSEGRFEAVPWPARFTRLHQTLAEFAREPTPQRPIPTRTASGRSGASPVQGGPIPGAIDQSIPVLIFPAMRSDSRRSGASGLASSWLLVELDTNVLRYRVFPDLADRYFGDSRSSDYEVAVVGGSAGQPEALYSSDAGFGGDKNLRSDDILNLFGPPVSRGATQPAMTAFRAVAGSLAGGRAGQDPSQAGGGFGPVQFEPIRFDPIHDSQENSDWQIVAKSRKGSVEAVVAGLRRRNLALSFGVLLVLAATMGLILFTTQRARRLARLQMDFVAGVSHELRTPLAAILSAAENIADGVVDNKQQLLRYGTIIKNQAKQLNHLVNQALRFAAVQKNKTSGYAAHPVAVSQAIDGALESTASAVSAAGFRVETVIEPGLPMVSADFEALSQCLQNLITNAVKYGGADRWMAIRAVSGRPGRGQEVCITVEDHGIGIEHEEIKQIFEPFYRSPAVTGSQVHGTGLGLTLAKNFAEAMGGHLTVQSKVGVGSSFTIHLPAAGGGQADQRVAGDLDAISTVGRGIHS